MAILYEVRNGKRDYMPLVKTEIFDELLSAEINGKVKCGGCFISPINPVASMEEVSSYFGESRGLQLVHFVVEFEPMELRDPNIVGHIANLLAQDIGGRYQTFWVLHDNDEYLHFHFIINPVSYIDGSRYPDANDSSNLEFVKLRATLEVILRCNRVRSLQYVPACVGNIPAS